jgi:hypothetical protein
MPTVAPHMSAWNWNYQNLAIEMLARMGTPTMRVRYEDLVRSPRETLSSIADFAGVPVDGAQLDFVVQEGSSYWTELGVTHSASGNPMRFATGRIGLRLDDEWRTAMPPAHRRTVTSLTLPLLRRYGYPTRLAA